MRTASFPPIPPTIWTVDVDQLIRLVKAAFTERFGADALEEMDWNHFPDGYTIYLYVKGGITAEMDRFCYDFDEHLLAHGVRASVRCTKHSV